MQNKINRKINIFIIMAFIVAGIFTFFYSAKAANQVNVTAYVIQKDGNAMSDGNYDVRFAIYSKNRTTIDPYPSNTDTGSRIWVESQNVNIYDGVLSAYLGTESPLPQNIDFNTGDYYLGVQIGIDSEMAPRKKIGAALSAINSSLLQGHTIGTAVGNVALVTKDGFDPKILANISEVGTISAGTWEGDPIESNFIVQDLTLNSLSLAGELYDSLDNAGTNGMLLQTTGTGTVWVDPEDLGLGGSTGIGNGITDGIAGSVLFVDADGNMGQDNTNFYWDDINNRLGVGTDGLYVNSAGISNDAGNSIAMNIPSIDFVDDVENPEEYASESSGPSGTVDAQIASGTDDCIVYATIGTNNWNLDNTNTLIGAGSLPSFGVNGLGVGLRFTGLNIPEDVSITEAHLSFYGTNFALVNGGFGTSARITGEKTLTPATFSDFDTSYKDRRGIVVGGANNDNITDAQVILPENTTWTNDAWNDSPDISEVIQEIVRLGAVTDLALFFDDHDRLSSLITNFLFTGASYDASSENAPKLHVEYAVLDTNLVAYSESTIVTQGTYSLRGEATITDSLNKTLTRTLDTPLDLTDKDFISFDLRSTRTGSNIKIGLHDSGGTTTEITPNLTAADEFQTISWDISGIANVDKDNIDQIIITIVNADAANTFYLDNMYVASDTRKMAFTVNNTERLTIDTNGYIGIGDSTPSYMLDVNGDINFNGELYQNGSLFVGSLWSSDGNDIYYDTGNVGIGTISPTAQLHLGAGTTVAGTAPLKFTSGDLLTIQEPGAMEFLGDDFYLTTTSGYESQYPPEQSDTYVKATTENSPDYMAYFATDPDKSLTGTNVSNEWKSTSSANQRFHIDLGEEKVITRIYYENGHDSGGFTYVAGAKNFTFWGSNEANAFAELTYGNDTNWTQLTTNQSYFEEHTDEDRSDPKYITVDNDDSYRYYAFKFADNWAGVGWLWGMGVRRIELQTESENTASRRGIVLNDGSNLIAGRIPFATTNGRLTDTENFVFDGTNVGIGTSTPSYMLDVAGDINVTGDLYQNGSLFGSSQWTTSGNDIYYDSGNVGIGVANPMGLLDARYKSAYESDSYAKLLLHADGDGNTFVDSSDSANVITAYGNVTQSAVQSKFGGKSAYFDGNEDYLSFQNSSDFAFGTGDFTIDFWINAPFQSNTFILGGRSAIGDLVIVTGGSDGAIPGSLRVGLASWGGNSISSTTIITDDTWHHCAVVRESGVITVYVDGTAEDSGADASNYTSTSGTWFMGMNDWAGGSHSEFLTGYLDEFRISKGIARWTDDFTPASKDGLILTDTGNVGIGTDTPTEMLSIGDSASYFNVTSQGDVYANQETLDGVSAADGIGASTTTLIIDDGTDFNIGNYVQVNSTDCVAGVDICYAKITDKTGNTLTISPAISWANDSVVTEVHIPEIGGTNTASTLANRFGRGYFIDGIVTGNGTTYFTDSGVTSVKDYSINSDQFFIEQSTGNVGIGTASPASILNINGTLGSLAGGLSFGDGDTGLYELTDDNLRLQTGGSDRLTVDSSGNIGIGATSPASILNINGTLGSLAGGLSFGDGNIGFYEYEDNVLRLQTQETTTEDPCTGGTETTDGNYVIRTFTTDGTLTCSNNIEAEILVVAGGGGGAPGEGDTWAGGGGGAGGVLYHAAKTLAAQAYPVVVGDGGASHTTGEDSSISDLVAKGGGKGLKRNEAATLGDGGSGGSGRVGTVHTGGASIQGNVGGGTGYGNRGGNCYTTTDSAGGGGGAGEAGGDSTADPASYKGGDGLAIFSDLLIGANAGEDIDGVHWIGGGGGGITGAGGKGGGGDGDYGQTMTAGTANTGGGGGGKFGGGGAGAAGGSGIVVVKYLIGRDANYDLMTFDGTKVGIGTTSPLNLLSLEQTGTAKANTNLLSITNSGNAADMDGTLSSILFNQYYYDASTPALIDSGNISVGTETDWTSTAATQDSYMSFSTVLAGNITERVRVTSDGYVGIGTTTPSQMLQVGTLANPGNVYIANGYICVDDNGTCAIGSPAAGTVYAVNAYTTGADYAEYFKTKDTDLKSGEAVCVDTSEDKSVKRCLNDGDNNIMGIVSTNPSIVGNRSEEQNNDPDHYKIIGMMGQVVGLVSSENGEIKVGDNLTASAIPGYMRKANAGESTVGVAMQEFKGTKGEIQILISRRNQSLTVEKVEEAVTENIKNMNVEEQVNNMIADAQTNLDNQMEETTQTIQELQDSLTQTNTEVATIEALQIKLQKQMEEIMELNKVTSEFITTLEVSDLVYKDKLGNLNLGEGKLTVKDIETDKVTAKDVVTDTLKMEDEKTSGKGLIETGETDVLILTPEASNDVKIYVTPIGNTFNQVLYVDEIVDSQSFNVKINKSVDEDINFNWLIVK